MKPMIWHPEEKDRKVKEYLRQVNHAPYPTIFLIVFSVFLLFTSIILLGIF